MFRPNWNHMAVAAVVVATIAMAPSQADAHSWWGWGHHGHASYYSSCYSCSYTGCYSECYDTGSWYLGYRPGPIRRALFGPYRWYHSPWTYSACCVADCAVESCCGNDAAAEVGPTRAQRPAETYERDTPQPDANSDADPNPHSSAPPQNDSPMGDSPMGSAPADSPTLADPQSEQAEPMARVAPAHTDRGVLSIRVPTQAKVTINGLLTKSAGTDREYVSHGLKPGFMYRYEIRAEMVRNGRTVQQSRTVYLTAGSRQDLAFNLTSPSDVEIAYLW